MGIRDRLIWKTARSYAVLRRLVQQTTGLELKGLGFMLRRLRGTADFEACGYRWHFDHRIASSFASLVSGSFLEPETQALLHHVAVNSPQGFVFVDVGANIGEMVVPMAAEPNCTRVIAFEPHPVCADVLEHNFRINGSRNAVVRPVLIGNGSPQPYVIDDAAPNSGIRPDVEGIELTPTVRLDDELGQVDRCVLLIDVEGAELDVMRSGRAFIERSQPLIVFEYHADTRKRFSLGDVLEVIGADYKLLRLRSDGMLDTNLDETWNVVAVHPDSTFWRVIEDRIV